MQKSALIFFIASIFIARVNRNLISLKPIN